MQSHYIRTRQKNKHLTGIERGKIEALRRQGWKVAAIAAEIAAGELPEMVQVGNEITDGMIWPLGKLPSADNGKTLASFVEGGLKAVHDTDAGIKTMIHIDKGGDNAASRRSTISSSTRTA